MQAVAHACIQLQCMYNITGVHMCACILNELVQGIQRLSLKWHSSCNCYKIELQQCKHCIWQQIQAIDRALVAVVSACRYDRTYACRGGKKIVAVSFLHCAWGSANNNAVNIMQLL